MKPIKLFTIAMIASAGLVASCSTQQLAQNSANDDVYNSVAKAQVMQYVPPVQQAQGGQYQDQGYGEDEYYGTSNPYYDMDYSSRINRFYNGNSSMGYYDPYYDGYSNYGYNNYGYNSYGLNYGLGYGLNWSTGYGLGLGLGFGWGGNPYWGYGGWGWNSPFYGGWGGWGPYSYYDRFGWGGGWYGGGLWGGGYYGGGLYSNNRTYRARPGNGGGGISTGRGTVSTNPNYGRPTRSGYANGANGTVSGRPTRNYQGNGNNQNYNPPTQMSRPTRTQSAPSYSPPPSSSGRGGGGSVGGGGGGGGRPSRAGRG